MTLDAVHWLAQITALDTPVLPEPVVLQLWRSLAWGGVLASLLAWVGQRWSPRLRWTAIAGLLLWCAVPGPLSPAYWLGLAFQAPSLSAVGLCVLALLRSGSAPVGALQNNLVAPPPPAGTAHGAPWVLACLGVALGWVLLADTLALTPVALYAWGFSPLTVAVLLLLILAPWAWTGQGRALCSVLALGLALGFGLLRLPTGNAWDAVLDPWLWLFLHGYLLRRWWIRRTTPFLRTPT